MSTNETLLSYDSIQKIRQYVDLKFSHLPKNKQADIVADAIVKVVENHLPSFSYDTKKKITQTVIKKMVVERNGPLKINDIAAIVEGQQLTDSDKLQYKKWCLDQKITSSDSTLSGETPKLIPTDSSLIKNKVNGVNKSAELTTNEIAVSELQAAAAYEHAVEINTPASLNGGVTSSTLVNSKLIVKKRKVSLFFSIAFVALFCLVIGLTKYTSILDQDKIVQAEHLSNMEEHTDSVKLYELPKNELPSIYQFVEFDQDIIKSYLNSRNSLLAEEPYFSAIYNTALEFNIHPVLLFSITGQEQGFVPKDHELADKIAQNPFNVFYSWQDYNTNIEDTTAIAARTIVNLSKDRPEDVEAIKWINRKYAEDEKWHEGVVWFFNTIVNYKKSE